jgi:hypothetical protein
LLIFSTERWCKLTLLKATEGLLIANDCNNHIHLMTGKNKDLIFPIKGIILQKFLRA